MRKAFALSTASLLVLLLSATAHAQESPSFEISYGLGGQFGGTANYDDFGIDVDQDGGFYTRFDFDFFPIEYFGVGPYIAFATSANDLSGDILMLEVGFNVKARAPIYEIAQNLDFIFTPGLSIGFRYFGVEITRDIIGLGINLGFDLRLRFSDRWDVWLEPGFVTQPAGGNSDTDVTFGPIGYVLLGVGMAF